MSDKFMKLALLLTAQDKMSSVVARATRRSEQHLEALRNKSNDLFGKGAGLIGTGVAMGAALAPAVSAFATLENSTTDLRVSMMAASGVVDPFFEKINKQAVELGNKLPGTTADFQNLFETLLNNGIKAESILNGVGKAAAYMGVSLKMDFVETGKFAAKIKEATGTTDADMIKLLDTITRVRNMGVEVEEMKYAFGRSAGGLKLVGAQGLEASKKIAAMYAILIRGGMSGETVGTGFNTVLNSLFDTKKVTKMQTEAKKLGLSLDFTKKGQFLGVDNFISQLDKLKDLTPQVRANIINALSGGGQDAAMLQTLITQGKKGYEGMIKEMEAKASLEQKVNAQLSTLANQWEATVGTTENALAAIGAGFAPELKLIVEFMGKAAEATQKFATEYPNVFKFIGLFTGMSAILVTLSGAVLLVKGALVALNVVAWANPYMLLAAGAIALIAAGYILYDQWDKVEAKLASIGITFDWIDPLITKVERLYNLFTDIGSLSGLARIGQFMLDPIGALQTANIATTAPTSSRWAPNLPTQPTRPSPNKTNTVQSVGFSPTINVYGAEGGKDTGKQVVKSLTSYESEFFKLLEKSNAQKERRSF